MGDACRRLSIGVLTIAVLIGPLQEGMATDLTLKELAAARVFYESSIEQIQGRFTLRFVPTRGVTHAPTALVMEDLLLDISFAVDIEGDAWRYEEVKSWLYTDISRTDRFQVRTVRTSAENKHQTLLYTMAKDPLPSDVPADAPHKLHYYAESRAEAAFSPVHFAGIPVRTINQSIGELLKSASAKVEGSEEVAGAKCVRVNVTAPAGARLRFWLDPARDFLPRRQELGATSAGEATITIESSEFQQFPDMAGGERRWFPTKGRVLSDGVEDREWEITDLQINPGLSKSSFLIDPASLPPGVAVRGDGRGGWYTGNRQDLFEEIERKVQAHDEEMERRLLSKRPLEARHSQLAGAAGDPVRVLPRDSRLVFWALGILSAGVLVIGLFFIVRARQR